MQDRKTLYLRNKDDKRQYLLNKLNDYQDNITQEQLSEEFMLGIKQEIGKSSDFKLILTDIYLFYAKIDRLICCISS